MVKQKQQETAYTKFSYSRKCVVIVVFMRFTVYFRRGSKWSGHFIDRLYNP